MILYWSHFVVIGWHFLIVSHRNTENQIRLNYSVEFSGRTL